jgi:hypothetical protein
MPEITCVGDDKHSKLRLAPGSPLFDAVHPDELVPSAWPDSLSDGLPHTLRSSASVGRSGGCEFDGSRNGHPEVRPHLEAAELDRGMFRLARTIRPDAQGVAWGDVQSGYWSRGLHKSGLEHRHTLQVADSSCPRRAGAQVEHMQSTKTLCKLTLGAASEPGRHQTAIGAGPLLPRATSEPAQNPWSHRLRKALNLRCRGWAFVTAQRQMFVGRQIKQKVLS